MSDHVPFEIQIEIMRRLPVKSLIRFRSVSKLWKSLISSSKFIADYTNLHSHRKHLLIRYNYTQCFVSIVDDDTFHQHKLFITTPGSLMCSYLQIVGSSHGLLCFVRWKWNNKEAVIWNPSIRKIDVIHLQNIVIKSCPHFEYSVVGFGVCPKTLDPKIVKFCTCECNVKVEVFTLSSRVWRSPLSNTNIMLSKNVHITSPKNVVIDGLIYWIAARETTRKRFYMIVSFDLTSETFMEIEFPDKLRLSCQITTQIFKLRESLAVVVRTMNPNVDFEVWKMEINGLTRSFTKLFDVDILPDLSNLHGFTKNGQLILEKKHSGHESSIHLVAYDPCTKSINNFGINGTTDVTSYTESLLLLDTAS